MAAPPHPPGNPVLGSALDLRRSQIRTYERVMREYGDVVRLAVGPPGVRFDLYCVFHPDGVKAVLAGSRAGFSKGNRFYRQIAEAFGSRLLTSEGERWDRTARNGANVDANAEMVQLALRVVGRAIFGDDVARAGDVLDSAFPVLNRHTFRRAMSPLAPPASWPTPDNRRAARAQQALYEVVDELIAHRQQAGADGDDLLSRLLRARDPDSGESMDLQQVRDEALIFLLAGHETTSTALTFTLHLLGRHAGEQQLVHEELDAVLGGRAPALDDAPALERTAMAIKEAMRLYPPAYALGRLSVTENEIGGYLIPAGSFVAVSQFATHRHPRFWEDPETFDPARFTAEREAARQPLRLLRVRRRPARLHRIALRDARGHHRRCPTAATLADPQRTRTCAAGHPGHHATAQGPRPHPARGPLGRGHKP